MNQKKLRILFLGTPDFAAASLEALVHDGHQIVAVVTAPDKPAGRGLDIQFSAVKKTALSHGLNILQPLRLKDEAFLDTLRNLDIDLGIVVAFRMMPQVLWSLPKMGTFNLHASLLPQYRGAAPIHWAVINGEKETGLTTFFLKHEIDTGDILLQEKTYIEPTENTGMLYERMMKQGAALVLQTVDLIEKGNYRPIAQAEASTLKSAPKIFKEMAEVNFNRPVEQVYNFIRGMNPFPGAWCKHDNKKYSLLECTYDIDGMEKSPGEVSSDDKTFIHIYCQGGKIILLRIKAEGKKGMTVKEFLNGSKF